MNLREALHNELVDVYQRKNETSQDRFNKYFSGKTFTTESEIESLGYFILREQYHNNTINEGLGDFISGLFGNLGGNVEQQLKEWLIGKGMDWFVKPFFNKVGGEDSAMYENIKKYVQVTFAEMPFSEVLSTMSDCSKMSKLMTFGLFEYLLDTMISKVGLSGPIVDNIRQELDRSFIENSALANKVASIAEDVVCGKSDSLKDRLKDFDVDFSFA